jgi:hypothetical protein
MTIYRASVNARAGINATNSPLFQLRSGATYRLRLREIIWTVTTAPTNAPQLAIVRHTTLGTSSTTVAGQLSDPAEAAATGTLDSAWSAAPTFSTSGPFLFNVTLPVTAGSVFYWSSSGSESDLVIPVSAGIQFNTLNASGATTGAHSLSLAWEE